MKKMKNVRRQTVQDPEMKMPKGKQGPRSPKFQRMIRKSNGSAAINPDWPKSSVHHPEDSSSEPSISKTIPSPVNNHSTGWNLEFQSHWSINPPVGTTMCPWTGNLSRPSGIKNGMCKWPRLKSADLDSSDKWQKCKSGFQKQAIDMGWSERQQGKNAKAAHKQSLWEIKATALVKRLDKIPKT